MTEWIAVTLGQVVDINPETTPKWGGEREIRYIDIAAVNKFLDLATINDDVPETVRAHYRALNANANDCTECGTCEENCPFGVVWSGSIPSRRTTLSWRRVAP